MSGVLFQIKKNGKSRHHKARYIDMAKVLPIIDVLGYDEQNSSFFSSSSFRFISI